MALVYSAILPHPPVLIPQIGKDNLEQLKQTSLAFEKIRQNMSSIDIDTLIIISPHGLVQSEAFSMNLSPIFTSNFEDFGDFSTKQSWQGDVGLTHKLKEALETRAPLQLFSESSLDHGCTVPLHLLTNDKQNYKIVPLYYSGMNNLAHFQLGQLLKKEILKRRESIAVIASGDLSHRLDKNAPGGYSSKAKKFDAKILKLLQEKKTEELIGLDHELILEASECGLKSILILLGILDQINYQANLLSYEAPFGVGYLCMEMSY